MAFPTAAQILSNYLFGQENVPIELKTDELIRPAGAGVRVEVDMNEYMSTGGGRFVRPGNFRYVRNFLSGADYSGFSLSPGTYTRDALLSAYGKPVRDGQLGVFQYLLGVSDPDFQDRAFVFGSGSFEVNKEALFVVNSDGSREIFDIGVVPLDDNFDFKSGNDIAKAFNWATEDFIDPSGIGRTVDIHFIGNISKRNLSWADFPALEQWNSLHNIDIDWTKLPAAAIEGAKLLNRRSFLDVIAYADKDNRAVYYDGVAPEHSGEMIALGLPLAVAYGAGVALIGGGGNDSLIGWKRNDELYGGSGDDELAGNGGNDFLAGDSGDDTLLGGAGDDSLSGGDDDDYMFGDEDRDYLLGGQGDDTLNGGTQDDTLFGGANDDELYGELGSDLIYGGDGADKLFGGENNDVLAGGLGSDEISGGSGADYLMDEGGSDFNHLSGDDGNDVLEVKAGSGRVVLEGGSDNDILLNGGGKSVLDGGIGEDSISGGEDADLIYGEEGADFIEAGGGDDYITGGKGADYLKGGAGNDNYIVDTNDFGVDLLEDNQGSDSIRVDGKDLGTATYDAAKMAWVTAEGVEIRKFDLGGSTTLAIGKTGDKLNTIYVRDWQPGQSGQRGQYGITLSGSEPVAQRPQGGTTTIPSLLDNNYVDFMVGDASDGGQGNDILSGTDAKSLLVGGIGNDVLDGRGGDDWLEGGAGTDFILTGDGNDVAYGGADGDLMRAGGVFRLSRGQVGGTGETALFWSSVPAGWLNTDIDTSTQFSYKVDGVTFNKPHPELAVFDIKFQPNYDSTPGAEGYLWWMNSSLPTASLEPQVAITVTLGDSEQVQRGANLTSAQAPTANFGKGMQLALYYDVGGYTLSPGTNAAGARLYGGTGNDLIYGANNNDKLYGEDDNDLLIGYDGDDELYGGAGNDELSGGAGRDFLDGGTNADTLVGGLGADVLSGGDGDDQLVGDAPYLFGTNDYPVGVVRNQMGGDLINGGVGNDSIWGDGGDDYLFGGANDDLVFGGEGDDHLFGDDGVDELQGGTGGDYLDGGANKDRLYGEDGGDLILGGSGEDLIHGGDDDDIVDGGADKDVVFGDSGNDNIRGGAGNDRLYGDGAGSKDGSDILEGGTGNDDLYGGGKGDMYVFAKGDGQDVVHDDGADGSRNVIVFKFARSEVRKLERAGNDLLIKYGVDDQVTVRGYYGGSAFSIGSPGAGDDAVEGEAQLAIAELRFEDGTVWGTDEILAMAPPPEPGTVPADPFSALAPLYFINALLSRESVKAAGKHSLSYSFANSAPAGVTGVFAFTDEQKQAVRQALSRFSSVLDLTFNELSNDAPADLTFHLDDLDSAGLGGLAGYASSQSGEVHLNSGLYSVERLNQYKQLVKQGSLEVGAEGFEVLLHEIGHALGLKHPFEPPVLPNAENSTANTVMSYTSSGNPATALAAFDIAALQYLYGVPSGFKSGNDTYGFGQRWLQDGGGIDQFDASNETVALSIDLTPGSWIYKGAKSASILADAQAFVGFGTQIENATSGSGNDTLTGNLQNNVLRGGAGSDSIDGGLGDDVLYGEVGDDTLIGGEGRDSLFGGDGNDLLRGEGADPLGDSDIDTLSGGAGNDTLESGDWGTKMDGGEGSDVFIWKLAATNITVTDTGSGSDQDKLKVNVLDERELTAAWSGDDLEIWHVPTSSSITLRGQLTGQGVETLELLSGKQLDRAAIASLGKTVGGLNGTAANNLIQGGDGNDTLRGFQGDDSLYAGGGHDQLEGGDGADLLMGEAGNDLLFGDAGNDTLSGGAGNDTLRGGAGSDFMQGGEGVDSYWWDPRGGDSDTLLDDGSTSDTDTLRLLGIQRVEDLGVVKSGDDLILIHLKTQATLTLRGQLLGNGVEFFQFENGTQIDRTVLLGKASVGSNIVGTDSYEVLRGGYGDDTISGLGNNDQLYGGYGNDSLDAGTGIDQLYGEFGNDTLTGYDGYDTLDGGAGNDVIFGRTGGYYNLVGGQGDDTLDATGGWENSLNGGDGNDVLINGKNLYAGAGDDILIDGEMMVGGQGNDRYRFTRLPRATVVEAPSEGGSDIIDLSALGSTYKPKFVRVSGSRPDALTDLGISSDITTNYIIVRDYFLGAPNEAVVERIILPDGRELSMADVISLVGQQTTTSGNDSIIGLSQNDSIDGGLGDDTLAGDLGNDTLIGGAGDDFLYGNTGNDVLAGGAGADLLTGGEGADVYRFGLGSGYDVLRERGQQSKEIDSIELGAGIAPADVTLLADGQDLVLLVGSGADQLRIRNHFTASEAAWGGALTPTDYAIERIAFADGTAWNAADLLSRTVVGSKTTQTGTSADDRFAVDHGGDQIVESANGGTDTVDSAVSYTLPNNVENLNLLGTVNGFLIGNDFNNTLRGNDGANVFNGPHPGYGGAVGTVTEALGSDTLIGGKGDDIYWVNRDGASNYWSPNSNDTVIELANEGYDTLVVQTFDATLPDNVEVLLDKYGSNSYVFTGNTVAPRNLRGNSLNNVIDATSAASGWVNYRVVGPDIFLDGGLGADTLIGGDAANVYVVDNINDLVIDKGNDTVPAIDVIRSSVSYALPSSIENLELTGGDSINGVGNSRANVLDGSQNSAVNRLSGGAGDDVYILGQGDVAIEQPGEGFDRIVIKNVQSGTTAFKIDDLAPNFEGLELVGASGSELTGNSADNYLGLGVTSDGFQVGHGTIFGGAGNDVLINSGGSIVLDGGTGSDTMIGNGNSNTYIVDNVGDVIRTDLSNQSNAQSHTALVQANYGAAPSFVKTVVANGTAGVQFAANGGLTDLRQSTYADTVVGSVSDDRYIIRSNDVIIESPSGGRDSVEVLLQSTGGAPDLYAVPLGVEDVRASGSGTVSGNGESNSLYADASGDMILMGLDGADKLTAAGSGNSTLVGGAGTDTYRIEYASYGTVSIRDSQSDGASETLVLTRDRSNFIAQQVGVDLHLAVPGAQKPSIIIESAFNTNLPSTVRTIQFSDGTFSIEQLISGQINGTSANDNITGTSAADVLIGLEGNDQIDGLGGSDLVVGGAGNDTLVGGSAGNPESDRLYGGTGDDYYVVYSGSVYEFANEGTDTILQSAANSYMLADNVENLTLAESAGVDAIGNNLANKIIGNALNNNLAGFAGNDTLNGMAGADTMDGGAGDDMYIVDVAGDVLKESAGGGVDTVEAGVNWTLASEFENLVLGGTGALNGTGNSVANTITGNSGNNRLDGKAGNDTLIGGAGNDTYVVDVAGDVIVELASGGIDTVEAGMTYALTAELENLLLTGTGAFNGTGNGLANTLTGNTGNNRLDGGAGSDAMSGGAGNDTYVVDASGDVVIEAAAGGTDTVEAGVTYALTADVENLLLTGTGSLNGTGNGLANTLTGNSGNNRLDGGAGIDTLVGGAGNDVYVVDVAGDLTTEVSGGGIDTVETGIGWTLAAEIENLLLTGSAAVNATGNGLANTLTGNSAANKLSGGTGNDTMIGGAGNDIYVVDAAGDVVTELVSGGTDAVEASVSYTLGAEVENLTLTGTSTIDGTGNSLANTLTGNSANNRLDGGAGIDTLVGGAGNDIYVVDNTADVVSEAASGGTDTVEANISYTLSAEVENLTLTGTSNLNGTGNSLANTLRGNASNNTLDGGTGNDTLIGGAGNDTYFVDATTDVITENASEGTDTVTSSVAYTLGANLENMTLSGTTAINATGNALANVLTGNSGANRIDGGAGTDTMIGGAGNDTYVVDVAGDVITESVSGGTDAVEASVSYTLGAEVENLTLTGTAAIDGTGNSLANTLTGNAGNNRLDGGAGIDTMVGGAGNDTYVVDNAGDVVSEVASSGTDTIESSISLTLAAEVENLTLTGTANLNATGNSVANTLRGNAGNNTLDGGAGNDTMIGGAGNDAYVVDSTTDVVTENANEGTDAVTSSVTYTLGANVENLTLSGTTAINATGNTLANVLTGNSAANRIDGGTGTDTMIGGAGNDTYVVDAAGDVITELAAGGTDAVETSVSYTLGAEIENLTLTGTAAIDGTGNSLANTLTGNAGNNRLNGGTGIDTMVGGAGNDTYVVDNAADVVTEAVSGGIDTIESSIAWTLAAEVENLTLTGTANLNATGNSVANTLRGNAGNNVLDGKAGNDTLIGGAGDDIYVVDATTDVVTESANEGTDTIQSSVTLTALAANVENLTLMGANAINGTGNTLDNVLTGNSAANNLSGGTGNDTLDGGAGKDTLVGGAGNDTYIVDATTDVVTEVAGEGTDTIKTSVTLSTLAANVENLTLTGTANLNATGNALANVLTGNSGANNLSGGDGNDTLDGGAGIDTMVGGLGDDIFYVDSTSDVVTEASSQGTDTIMTSVTLTTLATNVENLTLIGSGNINGTGSAGANVMTGNAGNNTLTGAAGNDTLDGKAGNDTLNGGAGADTYWFGKGYGSDLIIDSDATSGVKDVVRFTAGVAQSDIRFTQSGNALVATIKSSSEALTIQDWYLSANNRVEEFRFNDGTVLTSVQAQALVGAMAAFNPSGASIAMVDEPSQHLPRTVGIAVSGLA